MKKKSFSIATILLIFALFSFKSNNDNCLPKEIYANTLIKLAPYSLLKDYRVYFKKKKVTDPYETVSFPITLNSGIKYKFWVAQNPEYDSKLSFSLYTSDGGKRGFLFATNYRDDVNKFYESIEFQTESTMNCLIEISFKGGKEGCGVVISSFLK